MRVAKREIVACRPKLATCHLKTKNREPFFRQDEHDLQD